MGVASLAGRVWPQDAAGDGSPLGGRAAKNLGPGAFQGGSSVPSAWCGGRCNPGCHPPPRKLKLCGGGGVAPRPSPLSECGGGESIGRRGHVSNTRIGWRASRARRPLLPSWGPVSEGSGGRTAAEGSAGPRPASRVPARPNAAASLGPGLLAAGADPLPPTPLLTGSAWLPRPGT